MSAAQVKSNPNAENGNGVYHSLNMDVPDHWKAVPLEEVLDNIIGGGTPSKANLAYWVGSIPWLTVKEMRSRRPQDAIDHISKEAVRDSATNIIPADTVIIATRIGLGKVIRVPYEAAINQDLKALIAKPELEKGYLEYWILSIAEYLESIGSGTTVKGIRLEQLRSLPFPLAPLKEQKRIVAEIEKQFSRLDEAVANLKRVKANLKRYKAAVLKAAVEGKLTEDWRKQHPNVEPAGKLLERILVERRDRSAVKKHVEGAEDGTTGVFQVPVRWVWCKAYHLADVVDPQPSHRTPKESPGGVPYIGMGDVTKDGTIEFLAARKVSRQVLEEHRQRYQLRKGDFIFGKIGTLGAPARLPQPFDYTLSANVVLFLPNHAITYPGFLFYYMRSPFVSTHLIRKSKATSQPAFGIQKVREIPVLLPPMEEQGQMVAEIERRLSVIDELEATVEANLTRADRLRQSVLAKAFSGGLEKFQ